MVIDTWIPQAVEKIEYCGSNMWLSQGDTLRSWASFFGSVQRCKCFTAFQLNLYWTNATIAPENSQDLLSMVLLVVRDLQWSPTLGSNLVVPAAADDLTLFAENERLQLQQAPRPKTDGFWKSSILYVAIDPGLQTHASTQSTSLTHPRRGQMSFSATGRDLLLYGF